MKRAIPSPSTHPIKGPMIRLSMNFMSEFILTFLPTNQMNHLYYIFPSFILLPSILFRLRLE